MIGVQTIGNATLVAYDESPIISTDPWMGGDHYAYFGSWHLPYEIPEETGLMIDTELEFQIAELMVKHKLIKI